MKKYSSVKITLFHVALLSIFVSMATPLSLDSCRARAIRYNKSLHIADELVLQSRYRIKAARGAYLPSVDFTGLYFYNQKDLHLVDVDHIRSVISSWGIPSSVTSALIPDDLLAIDTHHVAAGAVSVVQPIFLGGKIVALNEIADNAERLSRSQRRLAADEVVVAVDEAYWLVVSLVQKLQLAHSYVALFDTLYSHVDALIVEGMATRIDELTISVARNEAEIAMTQTRNGLSVSRMLLAQLCGMPLDTVFTLRDEIEMHINTEHVLAEYSMESIYNRREELLSLGYLTRISQAQQRLALSAMLPSLALVGLYTFNTPNLYNGFETNFDGMFRVGVVLQVPIFHWGTNYYQYKASRSATVVARMEMDIAKERIELQVNQCRYKYTEAKQIYKMSVENMKQAQQNLDNAQYAFAEGVYTLAEVMAAQTAWYQAHVASIDAAIAVAVARDNYARAMGERLY